MVSSKCFQEESPSPFRFLAALIPPWAHTECDRFTGTIENRSTCPPISAILITAARPARPPPITTILGFDAIDFQSAGTTPALPIKTLSHHKGFHPVRVHGLQRCGQERVHRGSTHRDEQNSDQHADVAELSPRAIARRDPPLRGKQPKSISEVPGCTENSKRVERDRPRAHKFRLYLSECRRGMAENVNATEPQVPGVPDHVEERDRACPALRRVHPVSRPRILCHVAFAAIPDIEAIQRVIKNG